MAEDEAALDAGGGLDPTLFLALASRVRAPLPWVCHKTRLEQKFPCRKYEEDEAALEAGGDVDPTRHLALASRVRAPPTSALGVSLNTIRAKNPAQRTQLKCSAGASSGVHTRCPYP